MIKAEHITKKFDKFCAMSDISCTIPEGCIYGLVGSNGAGKSTLLRVISGIYKADMGCASVDGAPVYENPAAKAKILYVGDDLYFLKGATMRRMAQLYASAYPEFDNERFKRLSKSFGLNINAKITGFSKGMRRQAVLILAICSKPKYLLMDETFDGLDPIMRNLVRSLIVEDVAENRMTAVLSSHSLRELEDICDQLALIHKGGIVLEDEVDNMKTSLFKIQAAFSDGTDFSAPAGVQIMSVKRQGSVVNIIAKGDRQAALSELHSLNPLLLEVLPLTLEEVFTYEMAALGYSFDELIEEESGAGGAADILNNGLGSEAGVSESGAGFGTGISEKKQQAEGSANSGKEAK